MNKLEGKIALITGGNSGIGLLLRGGHMNFVKRGLGLLILSASVLLVNGTNPRCAAHARTADHSSATDAGETTQAKIARAMSAGPTDVVK